MGNIKTGTNLECPNCFKTFYIIKSRISKSKRHYCSLKCLSVFTAEQRSKKLSKKVYPFIGGSCKLCSGDIVIKSSNFDKPNRQFCSNSCKNTVSNTNRIWSKEAREKIRKSIKNTWKLGKIWHHKDLGYKKRISERLQGDKSHFWKGGLTNKNNLIRNSFRTRLWREAVFKRDNWMCVFCNARSKKGLKVLLEADHIKPFSRFPDLRFELSNGRTLCKPCHRTTDTFGVKSSALKYMPK